MNRNVRRLRPEQEPPEPAREEPSGVKRKTEEFRTFIFLTVVMAPVLAVVTVAGYGFIVWVYQMIAGPPGSGLS